MANINLGKKYIPKCPLCLKPFRKVWSPEKGLVYCCFEDTCMISIKALDPMLDKYDKIAKEPMPCPKCGEKMRFFCRSDGYLKAICPDIECNAKIEVSGEEIQPGE